MDEHELKPNYTFWCKLDKWNFKEAALLLHEINPFQFTQINFKLSLFPENNKLHEAYKIFLILKKTQPITYKSSLHPKEFIRMAQEKKLLIPLDCLNAIEHQYKTKSTTDSTPPLISRERHSLLKAIGILSLILTKESSKFNINHRPNSSQISEAILRKAELLNINQDGLKSLNRKIKEAFKLLAEDIT